MKKNLMLISLMFCACALFAKDYKAGEIQSKQSFHYGRFETRFYASDVSGVLSTMFLFENNGWQESDIWQEIDIEVFGKDPGNQWQSNIIYEENAAGPQLHAENIHTYDNSGIAAAWHTYTIDWTPEYVEWFVDGISVRKETDPQILDIIGAKPMLLMFNCWAHEDPGWVGELDANSTPTYQFVDYVKVYDWISDDAFENTPSFEDHFDNGMNNWNISNHTFEGNLADFVPSNAGTKDGNLILAFTNNNETGIDNATVPTDPVLNIEGNRPDDQFSVYPNPTADKVTIPSNAEWSLYNNKGIFIKSGNSSQVDMSALATGLYILQTKERRIKIHKK